MKKLLAALLCVMAGGVSLAGPRNPVISVETRGLAMVMGVNEGGELLFHHFGGRLDGAEAFSGKKTYRRADFGTDPLAYPAKGGRDFREPALQVVHANGDINTELRYVSHSVSPTADDNVTVTSVLLKDAVHPFEVELVYTAYARENVITTHSIIRNNGRKPVTLHNFYSSALPVKAGSYLLTHFHGAWAREMQMESTLLTHGSKSIESRKGVRTTHTENPSFLLGLDTQSFSENYGEVIGGALAWSGNYRINFEVDEFDVVNILAGINPLASQYPLAGGQAFTTPEMIYTYSFEGAGGVSRNFHDWARNYGVYDGHKTVPTLLNSWEGAYFDFDAQTLTGMIDDASDVGLEMFVLDDGWFGGKYPRNDTTSGLGDWQVNESKLPEGIDYIASYAHGKGLKFGIWIEPEMVDPRSELAEKHPDWVVKAAGREITTMRNQWLLDLTNPAVQDFVFSVFDRTMRLSPYISYIKWDANRHAETVGSAYLPAGEQSRFWIDYVQGFYRVMQRIRTKYPDVLIQACASGGGRMEYGALGYFNEFWTSDNTEALSRVRIQYGTSMIYPATVMGSHVSAVPNHQTNNVTPLKFRFDIACSGRLGMELQPADMTDAEKEFAARAITSYKGYRDIVMTGDLYRLASPYEGNVYSLMYVSKDKRRAVVFAYCIHYQGRTQTPKLRLRGLDPGFNYSVRELNVDKSALWADGSTLSGSFLVNSGLNPPIPRLYDSTVLLLEAE